MTESSTKATPRPLNPLYYTLLAERDRYRDALDSILVCVANGDPSFDWRPVIKRIAATALKEGE